MIVDNEVDELLFEVLRAGRRPRPRSRDEHQWNGIVSSHVYVIVD